MWKTIKTKAEKMIWASKNTGDAVSGEIQSQFVLVDAKKIKKLLNIDGLAEDNGKKELPQTSSKTPDNVEQEVLLTLQTIEAREVQRYTSRLDAYRSSMNALASDLDYSTLQKRKSEHLLSAEKDVDIGLNDLYRLKKNFLSAHNNLETFKKQNELEDISIRNQNNALWTMGITVMIFVFESFINTSFFGSAAEGNILSMLMYSIGISVLNLFIPYYIGQHFLNYKNSIDPSIRKYGYLFFYGTIFFLIMVNIGAANIREAVESLAKSGENISAASIGLKSIIEFNWYGFKSSFSYMLFFIGLFLGLLSFHRGYNADDPYPGYGALWRKVDKLENEISNHYADLQTNTNNELQKFNNYFHGILKDLGNRRERFTNINDSIENMIMRFSASQNQIAQAYKTVITDYRTINKKNRKTKAPEFFNKPLIYEHSFKLIEAKKSKNFIISVEKTLKEAKIYLPKIIEEINLEHRRLRNKIPTLEKLSKMKVE